MTAQAILIAGAAFVSLWLKSLSFQKYELGLRSLPAYGGINGMKKDFLINLSIILQKMEIGSQRVKGNRLIFLQIEKGF
jgi:hypothetical protein